MLSVTSSPRLSITGLRLFARVLALTLLLPFAALAQIAPSIITSPSNQTEIAGNNVLFSVTANGPAPLSYAWSFNGQAIANATSDTLVLSKITAANTGSYTVTVSNASGAVTSPAATLTVLPLGTSRGIDPTFVPTPAPEDSPKLLVEQPDGKVIVVANFTSLNNSFVQKGIARLNRDGSVDATFKVGSDLTSTNVNSLVLQSDGRIIVSGSFTSIGGVARPGLARLNSDASLDLTFAPNVLSLPGDVSILGIQADGKIVAASSAGVYRFRFDGTLDTPTPLVLPGRLALSADGKIVAASVVHNITLPPGPSYGTHIVIRRYNADGSADTAFTVADIRVDTLASIDVTLVALRVLDDNRVVVGYNYDLDYMGRGWVAARLNNDGTIDTSYSLAVSRRDSNHNAATPIIAVSSDGQLTVARTEWNIGFCYVQRYDANANLTFSYDFYRAFSNSIQSFSAVLALRSGEILAAGNLIPPDGPVSNLKSLVRLTTFAPNAPVIASTPGAVTVNAGDSASLHFVVTGTGPFDVSVNGGSATTSDSGVINVVLPNVQEDTTYTVKFTNFGGFVTSVPIAVHVNPSAPFFTTQPVDASIISAYTPDATVTFSATVKGTAPLSYQWYRNGALIAGATTSSLTVTPTSETAGDYILVVKNSIGQATSRTARLSVQAGSRIINLASRGSAGVGENALVAGFAIAGSSSKPLLIRAAGPALTKFALNGVAADPQLAIYDSNGVIVAQNDDWGGGNADTATFDRVGAFRFDAGSKDAALTATLPPGGYTAVVSTRGVTGIALVEVYEADNSVPRLVNLSSRLVVGTGEQIAVPGVVVRGAAAKKLLIRAVGPTLADFHVQTPLADPKLTLIGPNGSTIVSNDDWGTAANATEIADAAGHSGAFPLPAGSKDAASLVTLPPGNYTALVSGTGSTSGVVLVEVYEVP